MKSLNYRKSLLLMQRLLRGICRKISDAQLRNGVITSSEYLVELTSLQNQNRSKIT
jgi:hypothetical protein